MSSEESTPRPATSKSRGVCRYYTTPRGCFSGRSCRFSHGGPHTPFDDNKVCRYYAAGYCLRGSSCWFKHTRPQANASSSPGPSSQESPEQTVAPDEPNKDDDHLCCICMEKPVTYGLLADCSHVFCISCIRGWRESKGKTEDVVGSGVTKQCPLCRAESQFVTPSSHFYANDNPEKEATIARYKASMARVPCKHFQKSHPRHRFCPFGKDCFYKHENEDGTPYVFPLGADHYMEVSRLRRERNNRRRFPRQLFMDDIVNDWDIFGHDFEDEDDDIDDSVYVDDLFPWEDDLEVALDALHEVLHGERPVGDGDTPDLQPANDQLASGWDVEGSQEETTPHSLFYRLMDLMSQLGEHTGVHSD